MRPTASLSPSRPLSRASVARLARRLPVLALALLAVVGLEGCRLVKGIFEAGVGVGVFAVVAIIVVIGGIFAMMRRK